jgi:hypothetical protein
MEASVGGTVIPSQREASQGVEVNSHKISARTLLRLTAHLQASRREAPDNASLHQLDSRGFIAGRVH